MNETQNDNVNALFSRGCGAYDTDMAIAFLENRLSANERELYEVHVNACVSCGQQLGDLRALFESGDPNAFPRSSTAPPTAPPPSFGSGKPSGSAGVGRLLGFAARIVVGFLVLAAVLGAIALLVLAAMSQMRFQTTPSNVDYQPSQPPPRTSRSTSPADSGAPSQGTSSATTPEPSYTPLVRPGGVSPLIPSTLTTPPGGFPATPTPPPSGAFPGAGAPSSPQPPTPTSPPRKTSAAVVEPSSDSAEPRPRPVARPASENRDVAKAVADVAPGDALRRIHNKVFKKNEDGVLVDTAWRPDLDFQTVEVVAGSNEYLRLIEENNDLRPYFRLSDNLILVLGDVVYRVKPRSLSAT